jgi:hypothetical protein
MFITFVYFLLICALCGGDKIWYTCRIFFSGSLVAQTTVVEVNVPGLPVMLDLVFGICAFICCH